jgi:hypothetical protein
MLAFLCSSASYRLGLRRRTAAAPARLPRRHNAAPHGKAADRGHGWPGGKVRLTKCTLEPAAALALRTPADLNRRFADPRMPAGMPSGRRWSSGSRSASTVVWSGWPRRVFPAPASRAAHPRLVRRSLLPTADPVRRHRRAETAPAAVDRGRSAGAMCAKQRVEAVPTGEGCLKSTQTSHPTVGSRRGGDGLKLARAESAGATAPPPSRSDARLQSRTGNSVWPVSSAATAP